MRLSLVAAACAVALALGGVAAASTHAAGAGATASRTAATPAKKRVADVVRAWSRRLNAGDNRGVARLFSLPATLVQGSTVLRLVTYEQLTAWHAGLPCSGGIVSLTVSGRFATAVFVLGDRPASRCDAPRGTKAAVRFEVVRGKIRSWVQVPVPGGGNGPIV